jgi:hypothetical protein
LNISRDAQTARTGHEFPQPLLGLEVTPNRTSLQSLQYDRVEAPEQGIINVYSVFSRTLATATRPAFLEIMHSMTTYRPYTPDLLS